MRDYSATMTGYAQHRKYKVSECHNVSNSPTVENYIRSIRRETGKKYIWHKNIWNMINAQEKQMVDLSPVAHISDWGHLPQLIVISLN